MRLGLACAGQELERLHLPAPELTTALHSGGPAVVDGDPVRLGQVAASLPDDARTAAGPRGRVRVDLGRTGRNRLRC